ncbi:hypothetical protein [Streptococcus plurextorum]|uniref:hypothetical protein n=1 Tax=Streptococcus plurextorum TaxID=456876 RepID=UPI00040C65B4|nr:hypothetical protein [Streptococcus plurextorum]
MSFLNVYFGTPTEQKRDQYKALYNELNTCLTNFNLKLKKVEEKVDNYSGSRPTMSESFIPEDVFAVSEASVKRKVEEISGHQSLDSGKLSQAVDAAYQRYLYYAQLAEQERLAREAEERRRRSEAEKQNRRR